MTQKDPLGGTIIPFPIDAEARFLTRMKAKDWDEIWDRLEDRWLSLDDRLATKGEHD
ncbi:MAG: hypothetical protein V4533_03180 [Pseudomonadota bacterium]|jgi:hypothetical protein|uniref:hypothetical protein n=1 Tax=Sphingobium sp. CECT 9361 TaxID=2845384 RepID=UPI001E306448|nr:hypothetical protein [Sphingobium sp. CECT 9361]CAH0356482.1 hypothetical protein SPH9361_04124 [Sphingobium sp. CECT 9361]|tara:strand:- start:37351 stop:37521 length:171 start_codon:yes stop_codon:yes gene_type:complete